jgi:hypothetical protein
MNECWEFLPRGGNCESKAKRSAVRGLFNLESVRPSVRPSFSAPLFRRLSLSLLVVVVVVLVVDGALPRQGFLELLLALEIALASCHVALLAPLLTPRTDEVGDGSQDREDALDARLEVREGLLEVLLGLGVGCARSGGVLLGAVRLFGALSLDEVLRGLPSIGCQQVLRPRGPGCARPRDGERLLLRFLGLLGLGLVIFRHREHGIAV